MIGTLRIVSMFCALTLMSCAPSSAGVDYAQQRARMVEEQLAARGIKDAHVLDAMRSVPRHEFIPQSVRPLAYTDRPLPIGNDQTISQPYIVGLMTQLLQVDPGQRVLEIGTGSGYQAAVLHQITPNVYTIEIVESLYRQARERLLRAGFKASQIIYGDGYRGLPEKAPFDRIIVTAAPEKIPQPLLDQLAPGGRMVIPVGPAGSVQSLLVIDKDLEGRINQQKVLAVRFVPMTGEAESH